MSKTKNKLLRQKNSLLYENLMYTGVEQHDTRISFSVFDKDNVRQYDDIAINEIANHIDNAKTNWICVKGLRDTESIRQLGMSLGLPILWTQDMLNSRHHAKIEESPDGILSILKILSYNADKELRISHLSLILLPHLVISMQECDVDVFAEISDAIKKDIGKVRINNADYLYNLLISRAADSYLSVLDIQRDRVMDMEDVLMNADADNSSMGREIQDLRKENLAMRRNLSPLYDQFFELTNNTSILIKPENKIYYRDTYDHLRQVCQNIDSISDMLASLVDLYMSNNDLRLNKIIGRLTVVSVIFIPLTFLVGVWGMNFKVMPELDWKYGYAFAWGMMIVVAVVVAIWIKKKNWF